MPRLLEVDTQQERILKEYIAGKTVAELLKTGLTGINAFILLTHLLFYVKI